MGISSHNPVVAALAVQTGLVDVLMFSINPCYDLQPATDDIERLFDPESYSHALQNIDPAANISMNSADGKGLLLT